MLKYWPSYVDFKIGWSSGNYVFRPIDRLYEALTYSEIHQATIYSNTQLVQKMLFKHQETNKYTGAVEKEALVHVTFDADLSGVLQVDVDLDSLPNVYLDGYEVIVQFQAHDFDNNSTFYTDSNGLEMQKRVLNYRSYYNITEKILSQTNVNITSNYYPINSAIALKDSSQNLQFTVSNSRAQGGSALNPGQIELMQNRRIPNDDQKGEGEFMNETDAYGFGIRVPATYFV